MTCRCADPLCNEPGRTAPRRSSIAAVRCSLIVFALFVSACEPKFKAQGAFALEDAVFTPTACHVLAPRATGVELTDVTGARLELVLPPMTLEAFTELKGTPGAVLTTSGEAPIDLGPCGTLTLKGEGYHGGGKRAASGSASLACSAGSAHVMGTLTFSGCF